MAHRHAMLAFAAASVFAIPLATNALSETRQGVDAEVRFAPVLARSEGHNLLRYELLLTNFAKEPLALRRLDVVDANSGRTIASLTGDTLASALRPVRASGDPHTTSLEPGRLNLLFIDVKLPPDTAPKQLVHRLALSDGKSEFSVEGAATKVTAAAPSDLGPPLKGGPWVAVYDPAMDAGHRRYPYAVNGRMTVPGRFAIDWFKLDEQGHPVSGTGAPVIAVADATVVAARDDFTDPVPGSRPLGGDLDNDAGNYITLDLGHGRFAFYEHLKHGVLVRPGEKVRIGQVIAYLGMTGHVTGPHLHFHVTNSKSPLDADSIPFGFRNFRRLGAYESISDFDDGGSWRRDPHTDSGFPSPNEVLSFPD